MSRIISIFLIITFLFCVYGCSEPTEEILQPVNFYYCTKPITFHETHNVVIPEIRESNNCNSLVDLINLYLAGPIADTCSSPFPSSVTVVKFTQNKKIANITLSREFANLTGIELTLACSCLSSTIFDLTDAQSIVITVQDALLDDKESVVIIRDTLVITDSYSQSTEPTAQTEE